MPRLTKKLSSKTKAQNRKEAKAKSQVIEENVRKVVNLNKTPESARSFADLIKGMIYAKCPPVLFLLVDLMIRRPGIHLKPLVYCLELFSGQEACLINFLLRWLVASSVLFANKLAL
jgi:hypothetical protein